MCTLLNLITSVNQISWQLYQLFDHQVIRHGDQNLLMFSEQVITNKR
jgi:hypothetical protein